MNDVTPPSGSALRTIYGALAAGVLLYALIVLFVLEPLDSGLAPAVMRTVWLVVALGAVLVAGMIRGRIGAGTAASITAPQAAIVVWALAEGQALVGITATLLTGDRVPSVAALALFAWLWARYPPRAFTIG